MKPYNGHRSYNAWNVSLWISNVESTYLFALECKNTPRKDGRPVSAGLAALRFMKLYDGEKTDDGVPYTFLNVKLALDGLE
jgi:hypothetical protein